VKRRVQEIMEAMKESEREKKDSAKKPSIGDTARPKGPTTAAAGGKTLGRPTIKTEVGAKPLSTKPAAVTAKPAAAIKLLAAAKPSAASTKLTASSRPSSWTSTDATGRSRPATTSAIRSDGCLIGLWMSGREFRT
jgi:hypothetical protein